MFAKRLLQKAMPHQHNVQHGLLTPTDLDARIAYHYGIPSTASVLAFDPIQRLLAIGTLDGRIKVIGGDNIEGLLISPKKLPYKSLEIPLIHRGLLPPKVALIMAVATFLATVMATAIMGLLQFLHNEGYLVSVSNENDIQVWDLEQRRAADCLEWDANITAFSVIQGTYFMYVGDEYGLLSVVKYDTEEGKLLRLPYYTPANVIAEAAGISLPNNQSIVGILPQPCTSGNRVLIAYENGLIVLWDISEARVVLTRGYTDLQLKDEGMVGSPSKAGNKLEGHSSDYAEEKVICSLCWASTCGSILAVGYIDGDILLWNISSSLSTKGPQVGVPSNNVVKLQLSSGERRLPVIVLHWSPIGKSYNDRGGQLFIYGGDEIGSEEVLTVLTLEWSSGIETLRCIARVDLTLNGSFADMILINSETTEYNSTAALFVLTNPGQLNVYDGSRLSKVTSEEEKASIRAEQFPLTIPTVDPCMTVAKLILLSSDRNSSKALLEMSSAMKSGATPPLSAGMKWPLTGGVPSPLSVADDIGVKRLYISGYQDGSVRVWDATYPVLSLVSVLGGEVPGIQVAGISAPVSALDFCSITMSLAVGNECGLVRVYKLCESSNEKNCHFVTEAKHEVHITNHGKGFCCVAVISILNLPIRTFHFANSGAKLAVGFERGQVAMLDVGSFSIMFHTDCGSGLTSPVISVVAKELSHINTLVNSPKHKELKSPRDQELKSPRDQEPKSPRDQEPKSPRDPAEGVLFVLIRDAHIVVIDSLTGNMTCSRPLHPKKESTAISMYVIDGSISVSGVTSEKKPQQLSQDHDIEKGPDQTKSPGGNKQQEVELHSPDGTTCSAEGLSSTLILLCCEDALRLYSLKSVMEGGGKAIRKVNLVKPCCWSATFKTKDEKACGLALLYQTGVLEIRSLPDLEVVGESSLMSILRWSFKANMVKTMSSADSGQITLVNGCELAFISLVAGENDFRIPDSLPCLHDKVLAAAADAAINASLYQKKKQGTSPGILGGIIKGFKGEKAGHNTDLTGSLLKYSIIQQLESTFSRVPFSVPTTALTDDLGGVELDIGTDLGGVELDIDDIEIDEPSPPASALSSIGKHDRRDEETEREKLFHGTTSDMKPRLRTAEEIRAQYRKAGDASSVASDARDKLVQRQEKLERISRRTAELESGAENFAAMANELVKTMEARKWWKL